jgi:hypothetical protein
MKMKWLALVLGTFGLGCMRWNDDAADKEPASENNETTTAGAAMPRKFTKTNVKLSCSES